MSIRISHPPLLRRANQAVIAVLALAALAAIAGGWFLGGRFVEMDRPRPPTAEFQIDINTADWPEIALLPGIGETLARRIVHWRRHQGPFASYDDLLRVSGVGPRKLAGAKAYLLPMPQAGAIAGR